MTTIIVLTIIFLLAAAAVTCLAIGFIACLAIVISYIGIKWAFGGRN